MNIIKKISSYFATQKQIKTEQPYKAIRAKLLSFSKPADTNTILLDGFNVQDTLIPLNMHRYPGGEYAYIGLYLDHNDLYLLPLFRKRDTIIITSVYDLPSEMTYGRKIIESRVSKSLQNIQKYINTMPDRELVIKFIGTQIQACLVFN